MGKSDERFWDTAVYNRALSRWSLIAREARMTQLSVLHRQAARARLLRNQLNRLIHVADERLPIQGTGEIAKAHNADWAWRPEVWRAPVPVRGTAHAQNASKLGDKVTLFHDCSKSQMTLRQRRNTQNGDPADYGVCLDVFSFEGSFLSLVLDLPFEATEGLKRSHVLCLITLMEIERPIEVFVRLNIRHGPNTEQIVRTLPPGGGPVSVEFDLAYTTLNERRVEKAWIDLIFETPQMNQITLRDLTVSRRPRAAL